MTQYLIVSQRIHVQRLQECMRGIQVRYTCGFHLQDVAVILMSGPNFWNGGGGVVQPLSHFWDWDMTLTVKTTTQSTGQGCGATLKVINLKVVVVISTVIVFTVTQQSFVSDSLHCTDRPFWDYFTYCTYSSTQFHTYTVNIRTFYDFSFTHVEGMLYMTDALLTHSNNHFTYYFSKW